MPVLTTMTVIAEISVAPLDTLLTYEVPPELCYLDTGYKVQVPLGNRKAEGFIIRRLSGADRTEGEVGQNFKLKSILSPLSESPAFDTNLLALFEWTSEYYGCPLSQVIEVAIPAVAPPTITKTVTLKSESAESLRGKVEREIIQLLKERGSIEHSEITKQWRGAAPILRRLDSKGVITITESKVWDRHKTSESIPDWAQNSVALSTEQETSLTQIIAAINKKHFEAFLLHGVTGSGKTEVYIEAIRYAREQGLGALVLVPEIALTPQLLDRFRARLGMDIAILHSSMSKGARWDSWRALEQGTTCIAIGARSCLFAPIKNLGIIIVDEEHEGSYKQSDGLRYHARDCAIMRAQFAKIPIVLGSATPSLETFHNAQKGKFTYLPLKARHSRATPLRFEVVDMNSLKPWNMPSKNISPRLYDSLRDTIAAGHQAFILYNRRGFASYLQCEKCEATLECRDCSVTLTYHQHSNSLVCHYCGAHEHPPLWCPECTKKLHATTQATVGPEYQVTEVPEEQKPGALIHRGAGTEKIFEELTALFPNVAMERLDRDVADNVEQYREMLGRVREGTTQVLIGTQMIAKGHDLPGVTLVGVVDCDVGLHMPDFRAAERVFQLLTQASGRAGRGADAGSVILQTRLPRHPSITKTLTSDFASFATGELLIRKGLLYPPFTRLARVVVHAPEREIAMETLRAMRRGLEAFLRRDNVSATVIGPAPAPLPRLKTEWRCHMLIKTVSPKSLIQISKFLQLLRPKAPRIKTIIDVDPQEML